MQEYKKTYFIGIGGIGMSALAQLFVYRNVEVSGSDRSASPVTDLLKERGITVTIGQSEDNVPTDADLVVYSDAVPEDNPERARATALGIKALSYFEALGEATRDLDTIVIAGTHGKTTTTAMIAKVLIDAGLSPTVIAGSVMSEYGSNFVPGTSALCVVEGCEYRRHFLKLSPKVLVITTIEYDHTDYYHDLADVIDAFHTAALSVPEGGAIVANLTEQNTAQALAGVALPPHDYLLEMIPRLLLPGAHNRKNAQAAKAAVKALGREVSDEVIDTALAAFQGTWRRFEYKGTMENGAVIYDDYAHHPTALRVTLKTLREEFPTKKIVVAFHPHLFSRTRDLFEDFAKAFTDADEVVLAPIYAAREHDDGSVSSVRLAERITDNGTPAQVFDSFEEITAYLSRIAGPDTVILTVGAGDIYKVAEKLVQPV